MSEKLFEWNEHCRNYRCLFGGSGGSLFRWSLCWVYCIKMATEIERFCLFWRVLFCWSGGMYLKIKCNDSKEKVRTKEKNSGGKRKFVVCFLHKGCIPFQGFYSDFVKSKCRCKKAFFEKLKKRTGLTEDSFGDYNSDIYWIANSYFVKDENSVHCKKLNNWLDMFGCLRNYSCA